MNSDSCSFTGQILFSAIHLGPYKAISPVECVINSRIKSSFLVDGAARQTRIKDCLPYLDAKLIGVDHDNISKLFRDRQVRGIVRSSSEGVAGPNIEHLVSKAALDHGIPVFVIEDFPGNYIQMRGERLDGLFVEGTYGFDLHSSRGINPSIIHNIGNPRYEFLKLIDVIALKNRTKKDLLLNEGPVVLWLGQPDRESYLTLQRILNNTFAPFTLLFKAHPRDQFYLDGIYEQLWKNTNIKVIDVSSFVEPISLYCSCDLVITQFSSAAVEASHLGIPALFVLFEDLGRKYLMEHKGYDVLPWCYEDAAFLIENTEDISEMITCALYDNLSRRRITENFRNTFGNHVVNTTHIAEIILKTTRENS